MTMNIFDIGVSLSINEDEALAIMQKIFPLLPFLPMTEALKCQDKKNLWIWVTHYDNSVFPSQIKFGGHLNSKRGIIAMFYMCAVDSYLWHSIVGPCVTVFAMAMTQPLIGALYLMAKIFIWLMMAMPTLIVNLGVTSK